MRWYAEGKEMLEHRWVIDAFPELEVHHRNRDRQDNRPENLVALTHADHRVEHHKVPIETIARLYAEGLSTITVGMRVGMAPSQVMRRLRSAGIPRRSSGVARRRDVDEAEILRRHDAGERATPIGVSMGFGREIVARVLRENGRTPHRPGRPPS